MRDQVDLLFGNEDELCSLYEVGSLDEAIARRAPGVRARRRHRRRRGLVRRHRPTAIVQVAAEPVDRVLDTTGAGDLYAAGFLYGLTNGESLADCARLGSIAAAEVISHVGPRPLVELRTLVG